MYNIISAISGILESSWHFLMHTFIPGTQIAYGTLFIGLCAMAIGFRFLSIAVGHNIGEAEDGYNAGVSYFKSQRSRNVKVSKERSLDVR